MKKNMKEYVPSEVYNKSSYYREVGYNLTKKEQFSRGLKYYDISLSVEPDNLRALRGRSITRALVCKYQDALKDIETILDIDSSNIYVLGNKAVATYLSCEFEDSMIQNTRLTKLRKKPENFILGTMFCADSIHNSVGPRAGHPLRNHYKIIRRNAWDKTIQSQKSAQPSHKKTKKKLNQSKEEIKQPVSPKKKLAKVADILAHKNEPLKKPHSFSHQSIQMMQDKLSQDLTSRYSIEAKARESDMRMSFYTEGSSIKDSLRSEEEVTIKVLPCGPFPYRPTQCRTTNIENYMAERYLNKMCLDKTFLKRLQNIDGLFTPNKAGGKRIMAIAKSGYKYVRYNQELLRTRRPFYFLRHQDFRVGGKLHERRAEHERLLVENCSREASSLVEALNCAVNEHELHDLLLLSERLALFCEKTPRHILEGRDLYLQTLYRLVRDGFYTVLSFHEGMTERDKRGRVAVVFNLSDIQQPSKDSLFNQFQDKFYDWKKLCTVFENRVRNADNLEAAIWCYHELSRIYYGLKAYDVAKSYATKCMKDAYMEKDYRWIINAQILLAKNAIAHKDKNGAKLELRHAQRIAHILEDDTLLDFITLSLEVLMECPMETIEGPKMLEKRQEKILKIIQNPQLRKEASQIFHRISSLPNNRKMPLIPGFAYDIKEQKTKKAVTASSSSSGSLSHRDQKKKSRSARGIKFMDLIQYHLDL